MQSEIKQFHRRIGATVIYVTHDQHEAAYLADRTAILNHGRIVQCAPQRQLYDAPHDAFVAGFLGHANLLPVLSQDCQGGTCRATTASGLALVVRRRTGRTARGRLHPPGTCRAVAQQAWPRPIACPPPSPTWCMPRAACTTPQRSTDKCTLLARVLSHRAGEEYRHRRCGVPGHRSRHMSILIPA